MPIILNLLWELKKFHVPIFFYRQNNICTLNLLFQNFSSKISFPIRFLCISLHILVVYSTLDHCSLHPFNGTPTPCVNLFQNEVHCFGSGANGNIFWNLFLIQPIAAKILLLNLAMLPSWFLSYVCLIIVFCLHFYSV